MKKPRQETVERGGLFDQTSAFFLYHADIQLSIHGIYLYVDVTAYSCRRQTCQATNYVCCNSDTDYNLRVMIGTFMRLVVPIHQLYDPPWWKKRTSKHGMSTISLNHLCNISLGCRGSTLRKAGASPIVHKYITAAFEKRRIPCHV